MMKQLFLTLLLIQVTSHSFAQLTVDNQGTVIVGNECSQNNKLIVGESSVLPISPDKANIKSILRTCEDLLNVSVYGETFLREPAEYHSSGSQRIATCGVAGLAGNGHHSANYGTIGILFGDNGGAAIYGEVCDYSSELGLSSINGYYSAYFDGPVAMNGTATLRGNAFITNDMTLNENIKPLGGDGARQNVLSNVLRLQTYEYTQKADEETNYDGLPEKLKDEEEAG